MCNEAISIMRRLNKMLDLDKYSTYGDSDDRD